MSFNTRFDEEEGCHGVVWKGGVAIGYHHGGTCQGLFVQDLFWYLWFFRDASVLLTTVQGKLRTVLPKPCDKLPSRTGGGA